MDYYTAQEVVQLRAGVDIVIVVVVEHIQEREDRKSRVGNCLLAVQVGWELQSLDLPITVHQLMRSLIPEDGLTCCTFLA